MSEIIDDVLEWMLTNGEGFPALNDAERMRAYEELERKGRVVRDAETYTGNDGIERACFRLTKEQKVLHFSRTPTR